MKTGVMRLAVPLFALCILGCDGGSGPREFNLTGEWVVEDSECHVPENASVAIESDDEWIDGSDLWPVEFALEQEGDRLVATSPDDEETFALRLDGDRIAGDYEELIEEFDVAVTVMLDGMVLSNNELEWNIATEIAWGGARVSVACDMEIVRK